MPPRAGDRDEQLEHWREVDDAQAQKELGEAVQESLMITRRGDYGVAEGQKKQMVGRPRTWLGRGIVGLAEKYL